MTLVLLAVTFVLIAIAARYSTRSPAATPSVPSAPPAAAPIDPALQQWLRLRGGAPARTTAMRPTGVAPKIVDMPVHQYRARGTARVYRERPVGFQPRAIVLHATGGGQPGSGFATLAQLHGYFDGPGARASSHFAVDRAGHIARFVDESKAAFHVAAPGWNDVSIGIELLNDNSGADAFTGAQLRATSDLVRSLGSRFGIPVEAVVRHRTIQPADRRDPAGNFPWTAWLASLS